jgi:HAD superfamily hydrolase (TIGR01509 family)
MKALIFDCDGVLVDTERDGHRVAFNEAFREKGLDVHWDVDLYGELLKVAGGKERMKHFFNTTRWPEGVVDKDAFIRELHLLKTDLFMKIIERGDLPLRSGVKRLVDEAIHAGITLAVCSTSNEKAVNLVVQTMLGPERKKSFAGIFAGDIVHKKKPDPEIYNLASKELGLEPSSCVVVEDSRNGLLAAIHAGMHCLVTKSHYTREEDFSEADQVVDELGDPPDVKIEFEDLQKLI